MARGRMIKPEMWTSKRINSVSLEANLLFVALLNFCDDFGTIEDCDRKILGNCFPYRQNISEKDIEKWKNELISVSLVAKIEYENKKLLCVVKWEKHQTIMNRSKRNNLNNSLSNQDIMQIIETLISVSVDSNYVIDNRKEIIEKRKEKKENLYPDDFEKAWELYKRKGGKKAALNEWKKLTEVEKQKTLQVIPDYIGAIKDLTFLPDFERYLKRGLFEGEVMADKNKNAGNQLGFLEMLNKKKMED